MQPPLPEPSTCAPVEVPVPLLPDDEPAPPVTVLEPSSVSAPDAESTPEAPEVAASPPLVDQLSPELSGGPMGSTEPHPASRSISGVHRTPSMLAAWEMAERIEFYRAGDDYGEFSNFSRHPIDLGGHTWPTTEHYFQAMKFEDPALRERIRNAPSPGEAARMGRRLPGLRDDWEAVKEDVMMDALRAKFTQHDKCRRRLLQTGDAQLVEHTRNDVYWADGGDGRGKNRLGALLMQLRDELRDR